MKDSKILFPFGKSDEIIKKHVIQNGCFKTDENIRLYNNWFTYTRPRDNLLRQLDKKFKISSGTILDAGCGYGSHIAFGQPGSYGIELDDHRFAFTSSIGLTCFKRNLEKDNCSDLPQVDTVLCLSTLEHLEREHTVLRKLVERIKPNGLLVVSVPCRPVNRRLEKSPFFRRFFDEHGDHINGYSPSVLAFRCERAGVSSIMARRYSIPLIWRLSWLPVILMDWLPLSLVGNASVYVGRKIPNWEYPKKSTRKRFDNEHGYISSPGYLTQDREIIPK